MKFSKKINNLNLVEQVDLLKKKVYITHPNFHRWTGTIVSIRISSTYYWVLLDDFYENKKGKKTRLRMFDEKYIRVVD